MSNTRLLTAEQVGQRLGFSGRTIRRWVHQEGLPALKLGAAPQSPLRVDAAELDAWLDARHLTKENQ